MLKNILDAFISKNSEELASFFSEDCVYFDYCPSSVGRQNYYLYGRDGLEMFFRNRFASGQFEIGSPKVEGPDTASFFGAYYGPYVFARIRIEEFGDDGLVRKAVVHPA
jgi:hypothetical protein